MKAFSPMTVDNITKKIWYIILNQEIHKSLKLTNNPAETFKVQKSRPNQ